VKLGILQKESGKKSLKTLNSMKKIQPFKIKVTPEQSAKVQEVLFRHHCRWASGSRKIILINSPYLFLNAGNYITKTEELSYFISNSFSEITFDQFMTLYDVPALPEKWFVLYNSLEEFRKINKYYQKNWAYHSTRGENGYHNQDGRGNNWISSCDYQKSLLEDGFIQISFSDWHGAIFGNVSKENIIEIISQALQGYVEDSISTDEEEKKKLQEAWDIVVNILKNE